MRNTRLKVTKFTRSARNMPELQILGQLENFGFFVTKLLGQPDTGCTQNTAWRPKNRHDRREKNLHNSENVGFGVVFDAEFDGNNRFSVQIFIFGQLENFGFSSKIRLALGTTAFGIMTKIACRPCGKLRNSTNATEKICTALKTWGST